MKLEAWHSIALTILIAVSILHDMRVEHLEKRQAVADSDIEFLTTNIVRMLDSGIVLSTKVNRLARQASSNFVEIAEEVAKIDQRIGRLEIRPVWDLSGIVVTTNLDPTTFP